MRSVALASLLLVSSAGCDRGTSTAGGPVAVVAPSAAPTQNAAPAPATPRPATPPPTAAAMAVGAAPGTPPRTPPVAAVPPIDCEKLLGAAAASRIAGAKLVAVPMPEGEYATCEWAKAPGDTRAFVRVDVACQAGAIRVYRAVDQKLQAGGRRVDIGHKAVLLDDKTQATVQFVDALSPCGAVVTVAPGARAVDAAREVQAHLAATAMH